MKSKYKFQLILFMALVVAMVWTGCSDDEDGKPFINYVRITDPSASDSLLVAAGQGQLIAIMGGNLASVREVWFNDRSALLVPTMVTNNTIIVRVPSAIPSEVTNKLRLVFSDGESLLHDFQVAINKPLVERLKSEWVNEGDTAIISTAR